MPYRGDDTNLRVWQRFLMLVVGIGGLWFIPTFHNITKLVALPRRTVRAERAVGGKRDDEPQTHGRGQNDSTPNAPRFCNTASFN